MPTNRAFRPGLDRLARLLMFVGISSLLVGFPLFSQTQHSSRVWWLIAAFGLWLLGLIAQRFSTPVPLTTISTPPGWPWFFSLIVVFPMVGTWVTWQWPWTFLLVIFAATVGGWAAYFPEHRRRAVYEQYRQENVNRSVTSHS